MDGARQRFELVRSDGHSEIEIVTSDTFRAWQDGVETRRTINATGRRVRQAHSILAEFHRRSDEVEQLAAEVLRDHDHASYVLSLTFSDTERWQLWIDATTGETLRVLCNTVAGGEPTLYEEWWFDHQLCGQRRVAHRIVTLNNGRVLKESTLRSWDEDPEIPPDAFDQP